MPDSFISISAVDATVAYAVGNSGGIYKTDNGGVTFNKVGVLQPARTTFQDITFINEQTGYATNGKRLYKTTDGGKNWTVEVGLADNILIELDFTDAKHGWACGSHGTILVYHG